MDTAQLKIRLHLGAEQCSVSWRDAGGPGEWLLQIGSLRTAREHFHHVPPSALELEDAIQAVEDAIMPLWQALPRGGSLYCSDGLLREMAVLSGSATATQLSLDEVEHLFGRMTAISLGRPASQDVLRGGGDLAAALLILREFMHHLKFDAIHLLPDAHAG
jgi:exopolyphosphatase/pppGpp-phosphohydrolase